MGLFSWVASKVKETTDWVVDKAKKIGVAIKNGATNLWNKFSGKNQYLEAEKLYNDTKQKYESRKKRFDKDVAEYAERIEQHIKSINDSKVKIKTELFFAMRKKMEKIIDVTLSKEFSLDEYIPAEYSFDDIRSKSQLFQIDFDKHKFKTSMQAIFTLGFYTRKKATETLYAVQEESAKVDVEIAKMDAEMVKIKSIEKSFENIEYYFASLIEMYEIMLTRIDSSVNYLLVRCISVAKKIIHTEMSMKNLPKMQQKEFEAMFTMSKILKTMTDMQFVSTDNEQSVKDFDLQLRDKKTEIEVVYNAA